METRTKIDGREVVTYSTKETAQFIRLALKAAFPGVKFSVTTKYGSCYGATNVCWTDGPTEPEVCVVTDQFTSQGFDGMTESTTYHEQTFRGERVSFSGWVNTSRRISDGLRARAEAIAKVRGEDNVWSLLCRMRPNGVIVNLKERGLVEAAQ